MTEPGAMQKILDLAARFTGKRATYRFLQRL